MHRRARWPSPKSGRRSGPEPDTGGMTPSTDASDCESAAIRAFLLGADDDSIAQWEAAHRAALSAGGPEEAARYAFWLGFLLLAGGQPARANGWLARGDSLVARAGVECRASGYLHIPRGLAALEAGDARRARELGVRATEIGERFDDADLRCLGTLCEGQALIALGEPIAGVDKLDEVMLAATAGELNPFATGIAYCAVILRVRSPFGLEARFRMDERAQRLVRRPARLGAIPRTVPGAPIAAAAGRGRRAGRRRKRSRRLRAARRASAPGAGSGSLPTR